MTTIETHIDGDLLRKAEEIYSAAGFSLDDMVARMLERTVQDQSIPMDFFCPNTETVKAIEAARRGEVESFDSIKSLMADLHADD